MRPAKARIFAVVVTYRPDQELLSRLLHALGPQVTAGMVVNNGVSLPLADEVLRQAGFAVNHLQSNTGVAAALNTGFRWADAQGAEFVITFDQDSEPAPDMVARLLLAYQDLTFTGLKVGAVGPQQLDRRSGQCAAFMAPISWRRRLVTPDTGQNVEVDHLITSGCLVPLQAWKSSGSFLDALFIDYVDIEWSLRLRHQGWHFFGVGGAVLTHSIGDSVKHWLGRPISWHSPVRHYFMFRNSVYLQKLPCISLGWKVADAFHLVRKLVFYTLVASPRAVHVKAMLNGLRDGWHGRLGPDRRSD